MKVNVINQNETRSDLGKYKESSKSMHQIKNNEAYQGLPAEIIESIKASRNTLDSPISDNGLKMCDVLACIPAK